MLRLQVGQFWSGDLGLTLMTISVGFLVFVVTPLRQTGLRERAFFDLVVLALMISAALTVQHSWNSKIFMIVIVVATTIVLITARIHPSAWLREWASLLVTVTLLIYVRVVLLVMFRGGPVTWSRIQGGICAYLFLGMAWASAFQLIEQLHPGSFQFMSPALNMDDLTAKLTYYSFANLTTVGSDISPLSPFARSFTIAEAVVGQLYPAIFIGALVAMAMQTRSQTNSHH